MHGGLNLHCSEGIRSSLEEALKHLPGSSGAFLTFAGTTVAHIEFTVQGVDEVDSDHIRFAIFDSHRRAIAKIVPAYWPFTTPSSYWRGTSGAMLLVWSK